MESKLLPPTAAIPVHYLSGSDNLEIEVGRGESHYHIEQIGNSTQSYTFHLRHPGSCLRVTGLVKVNNEAIPQLNTQVIHHAANTKAETLIRTLVLDQGTPRYQGLIRIEKLAQNCESFLTHHSLLIGEGARSWTLPSLEILANQVKCSHAATVRTVTDLDLFYICSRGINRSEATQLLIEAFLSDMPQLRKDSLNRVVRGSQLE